MAGALSLRLAFPFGVFLLFLTAGSGRGEEAPSTPPPTQASTASQSPEVRERMAELLLLPKDQLWKELSKWPAFKKMSLDEQASFLARVAEMRRQTEKQALDHAVKIGLAIAPEKNEAFTDDYLRERLRLHRKFIAEKKIGKTPSPEAFAKELDRHLLKKYGPAVASAGAEGTPPSPLSGSGAVPPPAPSTAPGTP